MDSTYKILLKKIKSIQNHDFDEIALQVFQYQAQNNPLYKKYLHLLVKTIENVDSLDKIPFLPIQFFKSYPIQTGDWKPQAIYTSSGTTGQLTSQHLVKDKKFYLDNTVKGFSHFYQHPAEFATMGLLPSYLERSGSSLVDMVAHFIKLSKYPQSGFFLNNFKDLIQKIEDCKQNNIPVLLIGVSFALLDLAEQFELDLSHCIVMETGGMKGKRKEITRQELHSFLTKRFNIKAIHSEYGMTELLSQGYSQGEGIFQPCPTLRLLIRDVTDPLTMQPIGKSGGVNLIDLANLDSISFIATDDLGKIYPDNSFEILGRLDNSDIRGCNLMVE